MFFISIRNTSKRAFQLEILQSELFKHFVPAGVPLQIDSTVRAGVHLWTKRQISPLDKKTNGKCDSKRSLHATCVHLWTKKTNGKCGSKRSSLEKKDKKRSPLDKKTKWKMLF